ncbi:MAG: 50S ribosomal protein L3 [Deltaproteobacteria bacterium]|nr:50S ribosomal protein L3 [Deltaproteobacteria bacterium]
MFGLLGKKAGMTQIFSTDGEMIPVSVIQLGACQVVSKKTKKKHGYSAIQLGFLPVKEKKLSKAELGKFKKNNLSNYKLLREFRLEENFPLAEGAQVTANVFQVGDMVNVRGLTKGRGFQGVMKRHGKHGGPASHGSDFHRRPGSIGMRTQPGRVNKNMKMPGHMGDETVTIRNLEIVGVRVEDQAILVKGAVPGSRGSMVEIYLPDPKLAQREAFKVS